MKRLATIDCAVSETLEARRLLSFTPVGPYDLGMSGGRYDGVEAADFNNDGHLDLAAPYY